MCVFLTSLFFFAFSFATKSLVAAAAQKITFKRIERLQSSRSIRKLETCAQTIKKSSLTVPSAKLLSLYSVLFMECCYNLL